MIAVCAILVAFSFSVCTARAAGTTAPTAEYLPSIADVSALSLLASANQALQQYELQDSVMERKLRLSTAISSLTALYQLHGCEWALPTLQEVYARPDCPLMHVGYSEDGRICLRLEPLELRNPAFTDYTVLLCTLTSNTALDLLPDQHGQLVLTQGDGTVITADTLSEDHPLWPHLSSLVSTFEPPTALPSGAGIAFKQIIAVPNRSTTYIQTVSLQWGAYSLQVPFLENAQALSVR